MVDLLLWVVVKVLFLPRPSCSRGPTSLLVPNGVVIPPLGVDPSALVMPLVGALQPGDVFNISIFSLSVKRLTKDNALLLHHESEAVIKARGA